MTKLVDFFKTKSIEFALNVDLKEISTFRIGGNASIVCYPCNALQVSAIVRYCRDNNIRYIGIGRGSNVVFPDNGLKTLLIKTDKLDSIQKKDDSFVFGAGVMLARASKFTVDNGYAGMEFAYGIPGSVGGAVFMNAGAYGGEMSQIVSATEYVDNDGEICTLSCKDHDFGYRHSYFSDKECIITSTSVLLCRGSKSESEQKIHELQAARKSKQPLEYPSAGSVFKRPEGYFAGKLVQDCNLKGYSIGGATVSEKHSGFIINTGDATCDDVRNLVSHIQKVVYDKFGVSLECELKFITD